MDEGELLTRGPAWLAMVLYVAAVAVRLTARRRGRLRLARLCWTAGFLALAVHGCCAFGFYHDWSHAAAYEDTARRTAEATGWRWGGGLYFNYAMLILWAGDVLYWWRDLERRRIPCILDYGLQAFFAFMVFNATVVFADGVMRWFGSAATAVLVTLAVTAKMTNERSTNDERMTKLQ